MKKIITICTIIVFALSFQNLSARIKYPGKRHTTSHGGTYKSGKGSSHKGGTYKNAKTGNRYGRHR